MTKREIHIFEYQQSGKNQKLSIEEYCLHDKLNYTLI